MLNMKTERKNFTIKRTPLLLNEWRVKEIIDTLGMTQVEVAEKMGMTVANLNRYIKNHRSARRHIKRLAEILGVHPRRITLSAPKVPAEPLSKQAA